VSVRSTIQPTAFGLVLEGPEVTSIEFLDARTGRSLSSPALELLTPPEVPPPGLPVELADLQILESGGLEPVGFPGGPFLGTVSLPLLTARSWWARTCSRCAARASS
jgi:hypothetical protein